MSFGGLLLLFPAASGMRLPGNGLDSPGVDDELLHAATPSSRPDKTHIATSRVIDTSPEFKTDHGGDAFSPLARVDNAEINGICPVGVETLASPAA